MRSIESDRAVPTTLDSRNDKNKVAFYHPLAFWIGTLGLVVGVCLEGAVFARAAPMGYKMAGMSMGLLMPVGMWLIIFGIGSSGYGLMPPRSPIYGNAKGAHRIALDEVCVITEDIALSHNHWKILAVLTVALMVDAMKPATLGFILPGVSAEYHLTEQVVAILPFVALIGTMMGSMAWGVIGDRIGRRGSILLASLIFVGTSTCGAMPTFDGNVFMCFLMGLSAGGLLPIALTLLSETVPARQRSGLLVLVGGIGAVGGYLITASCALLLEPHYGWRIMWFLGLPTGFALILLNRYIPESPRFLVHQGRMVEAQRLMARFGAELAFQKKEYKLPLPQDINEKTALRQLFQYPYLPLTLSLNFFAVTLGLVSFAFLLWMPSDLHNLGFTIGASNVILTHSGAISFIGVPGAAWLSLRWSTKGSLVLFTLLLAIALSFFIAQSNAIVQHTTMLTVLITTVMVCANSILAMLLPYSADVYGNRIRARGVGMVAASTKVGGVVGLGVLFVGTTPGLSVSAILVAIPITLSVVLFKWYGIETRGRRLEEIRLPERQS